MSVGLNPKATPFTPNGLSGFPEPPTASPTDPNRRAAFSYYTHPHASARCFHTYTYQTDTITKDRKMNVHSLTAPGTNTCYNLNPHFDPRKQVSRTKPTAEHAYIAPHTRQLLIRPSPSNATQQSGDTKRSRLSLQREREVLPLPHSYLGCKDAPTGTGNTRTNMNNLIHHRHKYIPTPRVLIYNTNSYSSRPGNKEGERRQNRLQHNLNTLAKTSDIVMTQETKTESTSIVYNYFLQPHWKVYSNPNPDSLNSAGTDIFVSKTFLRNFRVDHLKVIPGYLQVLHLYPKTDDSLFLTPFTIVNIYLPSGSGNVAQTRRESILRALEGVDTPSKYIIAGGDWNLTLHASDNSGQDHFASNAQSRKSLSDALAVHGLKEVYQPLHTCVRAGKRPTSSRIDRLYISHSLSDMCSMSPLTSLPAHPYPPGGVTTV